VESATSRAAAAEPTSSVTVSPESIRAISSAPALLQQRVGRDLMLVRERPQGEQPLLDAFELMRVVLDVRVTTRKWSECPVHMNI
jgi:hypothetical protein